MANVCVMRSSEQLNCIQQLFQEKFCGKIRKEAKLLIALTAVLDEQGYLYFLILFFPSLKRNFCRRVSLKKVFNFFLFSPTLHEAAGGKHRRACSSTNL